jgi:hypothetical protein
LILDGQVDVGIGGATVPSKPAHSCSIASIVVPASGVPIAAIADTMVKEASSGRR